MSRFQRVIFGSAPSRLVQPNNIVMKLKQAFIFAGLVLCAPTAFSAMATPAEPITIFDNTPGGESGGLGATTNIWLAGKFCLGPESFRLDSLSLLLSSGNFGSGQQPPTTIRLQLYSHDVATGKPAFSTGLTLNLSGLTNPITLNPFHLVKCTPATPFTLDPNTCYWAVLSVDDGATAGWIPSARLPTGVAGTFGYTRSIVPGSTWLETTSNANFKMLIQGIPTGTGASPSLLAQHLGTGARIVWPLSASGFVLEESHPATGSWSQGTSPLATNATEIYLSAPAPVGTKFYRLRR